MVLTSINACESTSPSLWATGGLPEEYYLHNITRPNSTRGRLESWPGAYRLDLTRPEVQRYQSHLMYELVVLGGGEGHPKPPPGPALNASTIVFDGIFVDNVFLEDGWGVNAKDIHNNAFFPCTEACGCSAAHPVPDSEACFNAQWRSGIIAELEQFRVLMPHALVDGHAMGSNGPSEPLVGELFNAISIGFKTPEVVEARVAFEAAYGDYRRWNDAALVREPHITMIESAVRLMFGYGYGFDTQLQKAGEEGFIPIATLGWASREFQYMRFGLAFTLMQDGYFTHEIGDSWHGQDWRYDEEDFVLGAATSNATKVNVSGVPAPPPAVQMSSYVLWVGPNSSASLVMDGANRPPSVTSPSAKVTVDEVCPSAPGFVELQHKNVSYVAGQKYALRFWAKSNAPVGTALSVSIASLQMKAPWTTFWPGFAIEVPGSAEWALFTKVFVATHSTDHAIHSTVNFKGTANDTTTAPMGMAKISFMLGSRAKTTIWIGGLSLAVDNAANVYRRDFECGVALVNGDSKERAVSIGPGLARLEGTQAPRWQYILDDNSSAFAPASAPAAAPRAAQWVSSSAFEHGYDPVNAPSSEEDVGPYYHMFDGSVHLGGANAAAAFQLAIPTAGVYNISIWWPRATPAMAQWNSAMVATVRAASAQASPGSGGAVARTSVDLTQLGDRWFVVAANVELAPGAALELHCPASGGSCVADAVLIESAARYNDGAAVSNVTIGAKDGIVLRRLPPPAGCSREQ